jgi:DNA-binding CsgD family transcriptional regulator
MIGDRLHHAADTFHEATDETRKSVNVKSTIVPATEPVGGRACDPIVDLRIRTLTRRERELLGLLTNGWSNRRIASECLLSLHTVRTRVQNILVKLGVHSKLEAVAFAFEHGLVPPEGGWRPGEVEMPPQASRAAGPPRIAATAHGSIARSAPLGAAAPLPRGRPSLGRYSR